MPLPVVLSLEPLTSPNGQIEYRLATHALGWRMLGIKVILRFLPNVLSKQETAVGGQKSLSSGKTLGVGMDTAAPWEDSV